VLGTREEGLVAARGYQAGDDGLEACGAEHTARGQGGEESS
jgi:hypothetical protein